MVSVDIDFTIESMKESSSSEITYPVGVPTNLSVVYMLVPQGENEAVLFPLWFL